MSETTKPAWGESYCCQAPVVTVYTEAIDCGPPASTFNRCTKCNKSCAKINPTEITCSCICHTESKLKGFCSHCQKTVTNPTLEMSERIKRLRSHLESCDCINVTLYKELDDTIETLHKEATIMFEALLEVKHGGPIVLGSVVQGRKEDLMAIAENALSQISFHPTK